MIDFPASPTDGQIFSATNGVVYKYSVAYTSWLAQNPAPPLGGTGDFCAVQTSSFPTITGTLSTMILTQVLSGNANGVYSTSTGRYTPPAGRYAIDAGYSAAFSSASTLAVNIRKNGTVLVSDEDNVAGASNRGNPKASVIVDANGTDFFDMQASSTAGGATPISMTFQAFPLTGMQGPTGGAPGPVVGDFAAAGTPGIGTTAAVMVMPVLNGNSGGYYNAATGRWTPPAGRYNLYGAVGAYSNATAITISAALRKNGVVIFGLNAFTAQNGWGLCPIETQVDANGTDYFDLWASTSAAATGSQAYFGAFPTQGMVGPQGPPGGYGNATVGDFQAFTNSAGSSTTPVVIIFPTIITGNSGGYLNTTTGRYTPPAGRYKLSASVWGYSSAGGTQISFYIRKNGTSVTPNVPIQGTAGANSNSVVAYDCIVDANGTDYFEVVQSATAALSLSYAMFNATPTQGMVGPQGPMGPAGVTQTVFFETGAVATGTTTIPFDDTIPQITEGDQYMSLAITPQSATSKLIIDVKANVSSNLTSAFMTAALFQDATANALAAGWTNSNAVAGAPMQVGFTHVMTSGTTSATTFRVRAGTGNSGTTTFNGSAGARLYGGVMASSIVIREVP